MQAGLNHSFLKVAFLDLYKISNDARPPVIETTNQNSNPEPLLMIRIRSYRSGDWPRLCDIHDAARLDELSLTIGTGAFLSLEQTAGNEELFSYSLCVAELEGIVHGFAAYNDSELAWLYVDPACYRRGIGKALVRHVVENTPGPSLQIELLEGNEPALQLYQSLGFEIVKRMTGKLAGNETFAATGLVLEREIGSSDL